MGGKSSLGTTLSVHKLEGRTLQGVVGDDRGEPIEPGSRLRKLNKAAVAPCSSRRKRCPDVSDERFRGSVGGRLEGLWRRWGRYGAAKGQGGVEPASARAVCQTGEKFSVAGRSAYNEVAGGLTMVYMDDLKIYRISLQPAQA